MIYAALKAVHLLSLVVWVGGMFFTLTCLRPALTVLDGPARLRLMDAVLRRFFALVNLAIGAVLASGAWMLWRAPGPLTSWPHAWMAMIVLGLAMMAIFGHVSGVLFKRLHAAVQAQDWPAGAVVLVRIRGWVTANLVIGVVVIVVMRLGSVG